MATHFDIADYTNLENEEEIRDLRRAFFNWLHYLVQKHLEMPPKTMLDFGCSYGHLLDLFAEGGTATAGVEISSQILERLRRNGRHRIHRDIRDADIADQSLDLITAIDSIYYCGDISPVDLLGIFHKKLKSRGLLIIRTTNRNCIFKAYALLWHLLNNRCDRPVPLTDEICGDAIHNFSEKSLLKYIESAGLKRIAVYRWERKKRRPIAYLGDILAMATYYGSVGRIDICRGLVLIAQKA